MTAKLRGRAAPQRVSEVVFPCIIPYSSTGDNPSIRVTEFRNSNSEKITMTQYTAGENQSIRELLASRRAEFGLHREFYQSELIYRADLDRIWRRGWLFAGHTCQIPQPGNYFTVRLENDSLIIVRDDDGSLHALYNLCRHRGTEICDSQCGHVGRFVCPYHQWTYARDGALTSCRGMHEVNLDRSQLSLQAEKS